MTEKYKIDYRCDDFIKVKGYLAPVLIDVILINHDRITFKCKSYGKDIQVLVHEIEYKVVWNKVENND